ncbi:MAG: hypothetical protein JWL85_1025, partial [Candidatus Saccharibacteria bacterium]|nr:hypothetical protein [Candidatus Saccharibacteria bacterium]
MGRSISWFSQQVCIWVVLVATGASFLLPVFITTAAYAEGASAPVCTISDKLVNSCRPWLGAAVGNYPDLPAGHENQIYAHEERIGRPLDIVHLYHVPGERPLSDEDKLFA